MLRRRILIPVILAVMATLPLASIATAGTPPAHVVGAVYTITNAADGNAVIRLERLADGSLANPTEYPTGGSGTGAGLGSQGSVVLSPNGRWLLAVNAGSDFISVFRVRANGIHLKDTASSQGDTPISVTIRRGLVYVVNAGGTGNIAGFRLGGDGSLWPIAGSERPLSSTASGPAQIAFTPRGSKLVVTEKATNAISTYRVGPHGRAWGPKVTPSSGTTPFGFDFDQRGRLVVSEAFGGAAGASAASSYRLKEGGGLRVLSASVATTQTSACWVAIEGRYAYVSNTGSGTVSSYRIAADGTISLRHAVAGDTGMGSAPADSAVSDDGRFLYVVGGGSDEITVFRIWPGGQLAKVGTTELPPTALGIAAG